MIHPTAIIHPKASIAEAVRIDPYAVIGEGVSIGRGSHIKSHSVLEGPRLIIGENNEIGPHATLKSHTRLGDNNKIAPYCCIGAPPQDVKFREEESYVEIGHNNIMRECVTINRGTHHGGGLTRVGHNNFLMAYVHIAHDCKVGDHVVLANCTTLAGHVEIGEHAILGGMVAIAQFCRVGQFVFLGGDSKIAKDIPPFMIASRFSDSSEVRLRGINAIGLKRQGVDNTVIRHLKDAFQILFMSDLTLKEALAQIKRDFFTTPQIQQLVHFIESSKQGIIRQKREKYAEKNQYSRDRRGISRELSY